MWTIVNGPRGAYDKWNLISDDGKKKWQMFQRLIQKEHIHPKDAASRVGTVAHKASMGYEKLQGTADQHTIRLDGARRASFRVQQAGTGGTVTVLQVGGHEKSKK